MSQMHRPARLFRLAAVFSDHMVLQRGKPIRIFGTGFPGTEVRASLEIGGDIHTCRAAVREDGCWLVELESQPAAEDAVLLVTDGKSQFTFRNVAIGEVWLAGGQSNMEFELQNCAEGPESLQNDKNVPVRFYQTPRNAYPTEAFFAAEESASWTCFDEETARSWSAVGYYFARQLSRDLGGVTVGILGCNWGGTSASAWVSPETLADGGALESYLQEYEENCRGKTIEQQEEEFDEYLAFHTAWDQKCGQLYRENPSIEWAEVQKILGPCRYPGPASCKSPFRPGGLHEWMLRRVAPYTLAGCLYYQGESDDHKPQSYEKLLTKLIYQWRQDFMDEALPFLLVQLPMHRYRQDPDFGNWPIIRQAQQNVAQTVPQTGLAVIIDKGEFDNIHPVQKKEVGLRLEKQALHLVYGLLAKEDAWGPMVESARCVEDWVQIRFCYARENLVQTEEKIPGFELAGEDGKFCPAEAEMIANIVRLKVPAGMTPDRVRYLWMNWGPVALFGKNGLPVAPFNIQICR